MSWLLSLVNWLGSGVLDSLAGKWIDLKKAELSAGTDSDKLAVDLAKKELEVRQALLTAQLSSKFLAVPIWIIQMSFAIYIVQLLLVDKVLASWFDWNRSTDPLTGDLQVWGGMVVGSMFGHQLLKDFLSSRK